MSRKRLCAAERKLLLRMAADPDVALPGGGRLFERGMVTPVGYRTTGSERHSSTLLVYQITAKGARVAAQLAANGVRP